MKTRINITIPDSLLERIERVKDVKNSKLEKFNISKICTNAIFQAIIPHEVERDLLQLYSPEEIKKFVDGIYVKKSNLKEKDI